MEGRDAAEVGDGCEGGKGVKGKGRIGEEMERDGK